MTQRAELNGEDLYLDDLQVGQRFATRSRVITEDEIKAFAAQFDPQPFHLDDAAAKTSVFGGLAATRNQRNEVVQAMSFKLLAKRRHAPGISNAKTTGVSNE